MCVCFDNYLKTEEETSEQRTLVFLYVFEKKINEKRKCKDTKRNKNNNDVLFSNSTKYFPHFLLVIIYLQLLSFILSFLQNCLSNKSLF